VWSWLLLVVGARCPFVGGREAKELSIVAGPEAVGCRGAVSSTSCSKGWRSCRPCVVWALLEPEGREDARCPVDFVVCSLWGREVLTFLKHSVPQVSEYPKQLPFSSQCFLFLEPVTSWDTLDEIAVCSDGLRAKESAVSLVVPYERWVCPSWWPSACDIPFDCSCMGCLEFPASSSPILPSSSSPCS
jgi:hypothetical protein